MSDNQESVRLQISEGYRPQERGWKPAVQGGYKPVIGGGNMTPPTGGSGVKVPPPNTESSRS